MPLQKPALLFGHFTCVFCSPGQPFSSWNLLNYSLIFWLGNIICQWRIWIPNNFLSISKGTHVLTFPIQNATIEVKSNELHFTSKKGSVVYVITSDCPPTKIIGEHELFLPFMYLDRVTFADAYGVLACKDGKDPICFRFLTDDNSIDPMDVIIAPDGTLEQRQLTSPVAKGMKETKIWNFGRNKSGTWISEFSQSGPPVGRNK